MEINIKRFEELSTTELYEILRCRAEVFVVEQNCPYQDLDMADMHSTHVYIEDNGRIKSYLRVIDPGIKYPSAASIGRVLTMREYRGAGLTHLLMDEAIKNSPKHVAKDRNRSSKLFYAISISLWALSKHRASSCLTESRI